MTLVYWHWLVMGLALLVLELTLSGAFYILWLGLAAIVTGLVLLAAPGLPWPWQFALFSALSVVSVVVWHKYRPAVTPSDRPTLNRRGQSYVGRVFTLETPIVNGIGKLHVDDSQWRIAGSDVPAGSRVKVVQADGTTLKVERAD